MNYYFIDYIVFIIWSAGCVVVGYVIGLLIARYPGDTRSYYRDCYDDEMFMTDPNFITDGFGNWWPKWCPDCGAPMLVVRPGEARCSSECWIHQSHKNSMDGTTEK